MNFELSQVKTKITGLTDSFYAISFGIGELLFIFVAFYQTAIKSSLLSST